MGGFRPIHENDPSIFDCRCNNVPPAVKTKYKAMKSPTPIEKKKSCLVWKTWTQVMVTHSDVWYMYLSGLHKMITQQQQHMRVKSWGYPSRLIHVEESTKATRSWHHYQFLSALWPLHSTRFHYSHVMLCCLYHSAVLPLQALGREGSSI